MIIASGNIVHNLSKREWEKPEGAFAWAQRFDDAVAELMLSDPGAILKLVEHPDYSLAVPTPDHFIPLLYLAGLAAVGEGRATALIRGCTLGSVSMTCYGVGADVTLADSGGHAAPLPTNVPPEQTNI